MPDSLARRHESSDRRALVAVDRAIAELRRGEAVIVEDGAAAALMLAAEMAEPDGLGQLLALTGGAAWLGLTRERAAALGLIRPGILAGPVATLPVGAASEAESLRRLADPTAVAPVYQSPAPPDAELEASRRFAAYARAGIGLAKLARLLPAVVFGMLPANPGEEGRLEEEGRRPEAAGLLSVGIGEIAGYEVRAARSLTAVSEARVPLAGAEATRIIAFRPADGGIEHLAIVIGEPAADRPVLTRLHSACFTGDLLGSLRCDCGEQLKGAIAEIARQGSGLLLYLAQEGRGIGLVNKLRAYRLQDRGADTVDANLQLGFDADERVYLPAAEMLRQLGYPAVRLMTNNPEKVAGLARSGITVVERVPHVIPSNRHNEGYLETKAIRFGHLF